MTERLSEYALKANMDFGYKSLPWDVEKPSGFFAAIDFDKILESPSAREIIRSIPAQPLFFALKNKGLDESLDILPLLSHEQLVAMFDYDVWSEDRLDTGKAFSWLAKYMEISEEELFERYSHLDEEYQLALLSEKIQVFTDAEIEKLPETEQDGLIQMPCGKVFYKILSSDRNEIDFIKNLVGAALKYNLPYAYSLIQHASYLPPNETEHTLRQFRTARLEEDGFVSFDESQQIFLPLSLAEIHQKWESERNLVRKGAVLATESGMGSEGFLNRVLKYAPDSSLSIDEGFAIHQKLLYLANSLCTATNIEPDDVSGLNIMLQQCKAVTGLGLDFLSGGDLQLALKILKEEHPRTLFRTGVSLVDHVRSQVIRRFDSLGIEGTSQLRRFYERRKWGSIQWHIDRNFTGYFDLETVEILKGLFNRFPMCPILYNDKGEKALTIKFKPVYSVAVFGELLSYIDGLLALMFLLKEDGSQELLKYPIRKSILTATTRVFIGGYFNPQALNMDELSLVEKLSRAQIKALVDDLNEQIKEQLQKTENLWSIGKTYRSTRQAIDCALGLLGESIGDLMLSVENSGALSNLLFTSDQT
ncbi:MAG: hypothetical protein HQK54_15155 [Oligoflexales bacterium]|nr:hypothetical protein [Oligoflexales bacterium]